MALAGVDRSGVQAGAEQASSSHCVSPVGTQALGCLGLETFLDLATSASAKIYEL